MSTTSCRALRPASTLTGRRSSAPSPSETTSSESSCRVPSARPARSIDETTRGIGVAASAKHPVAAIDSLDKVLLSDNTPFGRARNDEDSVRGLRANEFDVHWSIPRAVQRRPRSLNVGGEGAPTERDGILVVKYWTRPAPRRVRLHSPTTSKPSRSTIGCSRAASAATTPAIGFCARTSW